MPRDPDDRSPSPSESMVESDDTEPEQSDGRKSRRKKTNQSLKQVLSSIVKQKHRDRVICRKLHDITRGVDSDASTKESFGQFVSTIMVHIDNNKFIKYATGLLNYTFFYINESQAAQSAGYVNPRSSSGPAPFAGDCTSGQGHESPLNLTTPPRNYRKKMREQSAASDAQASTSSHQSGALPNQQQPQQTCTNKNTDVGAPMNEAASSSGMPNMMHHSYSPSMYDQPSAYGANSYSRSMQDLMPGYGVNPLLSGDVVNPSGNVTYDDNGNVYANLQPAQINSGQQVMSGNWQTMSPAAPQALRQPSPCGSLDASLVSLAQNIQAAHSRLSKLKKQGKGKGQKDCDNQADDESSE